MDGLYLQLCVTSVTGCESVSAHDRPPQKHKMFRIAGYDSGYGTEEKDVTRNNRSKEVAALRYTVLHYFPK